MAWPGIVAMLASLVGCASSMDMDAYMQKYREKIANAGHCNDVPACVRVLADPRSTWKELEGASWFVHAFSASDEASSPAPGTTATLRSMLEAELRGPRLRLASDGIEGDDPMDCTYLVSAHTRRAVFILHALEGRIARSEPVPPELFDAARHADPRVSLTATLILAARLRDDAALPGLAEAIASAPTPNCVATVVEATMFFGGSRGASLLPAMMRRLEGDVPIPMVPPRLPMIVRSMRDPIAIDALGRSLATEDHDLRYESLLALAQFGTAADSQAARVRELADNWAPDVRQVAAFALKKIGEPPPPPHVTRRPSLATPTRGGWDVPLSTGIVALSSDVEPGPVPPACAGARPDEGVQGALVVDGICLFNIHIRSNVGTLLIDMSRQTKLSLPFYATRAVTVHGRPLVLGSGSIDALEHIDGGLRPRLIARFAGTLLAYGFDASGDLIVMTSGELLHWDEANSNPRAGVADVSLMCDGPPSPKAPTFVLRLGPDEQLSEAF